MRFMHIFQLDQTAQACVARDHCCSAHLRCMAFHVALAGGTKEEPAAEAQGVGGKVEGGSRKDAVFLATQQGWKAMTVVVPG